jgi:uncharacterized protein with HEPN domain
MPKDDSIRLQHMLDAALEAQLFSENCSRETLSSDRMRVLALIKEFEIIGEAANQVSLESRQQMPDIPWVEMVGMRNRLVHAYFDINLDILWQTLQQDLPYLILKLKKNLENRSIGSQ